MNSTWEEYLTISEIAEHLKLNHQTIRNWIAQGRLPAIRIGRRIRIRRADLDLILTQGTTTSTEPHPSLLLAAEAHDHLADTLSRARRLLGRRSAARRTELAETLQELADAVTTAMQPLPHDEHPS